MKSTWLRIALKDTLQLLLVFEVLLGITAIGSANNFEDISGLYLIFFVVTHLYGFVPAGVMATFCIMAFIRFLQSRRVK